MHRSVCQQNRECLIFFWLPALLKHWEKQLFFSPSLPLLPRKSRTFMRNCCNYPQNNNPQTWDQCHKLLYQLYSFQLPWHLMLGSRLFLLTGLWKSTSCTTHFHLLPWEGILICVSLLTQQGFPFWSCDIVRLRGQGKDQLFLTMITFKRKCIGKMTYKPKYRICSLCNQFYILAGIHTLGVDKSSALGENCPLEKYYSPQHVMV